jgi:hypothetical protein
LGESLGPARPVPVAAERAEAGGPGPGHGGRAGPPVAAEALRRAFPGNLYSRTGPPWRWTNTVTRVSDGGPAGVPAGAGAEAGPHQSANRYVRVTRMVLRVSGFRFP